MTTWKEQTFKKLRDTSLLAQFDRAMLGMSDSAPGAKEAALAQLRKRCCGPNSEFTKLHAEFKAEFVRDRLRQGMEKVFTEASADRGCIPSGGADFEVKTVTTSATLQQRQVGVAYWPVEELCNGLQSVKERLVSFSGVALEVTKALAITLVLAVAQVYSSRVYSSPARMRL